MVTLEELQKLQSFIPVEEVSGTHINIGLSGTFKRHWTLPPFFIPSLLLNNKAAALDFGLKGKERKSRTRGHTFFIFDKFSGEFYSNVNITLMFVLSSENECCCLFILSHLMFFFLM